MKLKKILLNLSIVAVSSSIGLFLCEFGCRLVLNPADYLSVDLKEDKILGRTMPAGTAGFDAWGFRNREVPKTVDIVAIGDSHTYGNCAKMDESWPAVMGLLTGKGVYNLGLGGYGPNQYYHLFKTRALGLKPRAIVCGLYMGDDFENAFLITYGLDHWSYLREISAGKVNFDIWEAPASPTWHKKIRIWLSGHSVIYKLVFHGPLLGRLKGEAQIKNASRLYDSATTLIVPEKNIREAFLPKNILRNLDQENENIKEGMRITFRLLKEMNEACLQNNIQFLVVVIPTKETVFSEYLEHNSKLPLSDVIDKLLANERIAREKLFKFFGDSNIRYVDTLPALQRSVEHELYTRTGFDMHPNNNGYRVIAGALAESLNSANR